MVSITSAQWMSILEGMQPRFRHVPPKGPSSTTATDMPRSAASADTSRPEPDPITIRSNLSIGPPLSQLGGHLGDVRRHVGAQVYPHGAAFGGLQRL